MSVVFTKTGIRSVAGKYPLEPESLVRLGMVIANVFSQGTKKDVAPKIVIGRDTRVSGYMIANALTSGLLAGGANVTLIGVLPTPAIVYYGESLRADASIVITASHNPYQDNGVKIFLPDGTRISDEMQKKIDELFQNDEQLECVKEIGKITKIQDGLRGYVEYLKGFFPKKLNLNGLKIGLDTANGSCYEAAELLLTELGAEVEIRGNKPNGKNINAGFGSVYPEVVSKLVVDNRLNLGIAVDGDGDRIVLSTDEGEVIDGDGILAIIGAYLKEQNELDNNVIVATIMSNMGLDSFFKNIGVQVKRSRVGEVPVLNEMQKFGAVVGGEQSGHMIFKCAGNSGDALVVALKVLEIMVSTKKSLKELLAGYKSFPQKLKNLNIIAKPDFDEIEGYKELKDKVQKEFGDDGRILIRYSETENKIRIMVEHKDEKICEDTNEMFVKFFEEKIGA